jgi:flavin reductase (DIM6/NTAB) family NADH-FMN oxidoreductase RutF
MIHQAVDPRAELTATFRDAMRRLAATVTIITAVDQTRHHGMTATAVTSLSMDPPSLLVCLNQRSLMHEIMFGARRFCVNVLHHDHAELSSAFAGALPPEKRFGLGAWEREADGLPWLRDAQAVLFCRRTAALPFGTHTIFIGEVIRASHREEIAPLVYENAVYCRTAPVALRQAA